MKMKILGSILSIVLMPVGLIVAVLTLPVLALLQAVVLLFMAVLSPFDLEDVWFFIECWWMIVKWAVWPVRR